jgi:hypothetical protein
MKAHDSPDTSAFMPVSTCPPTASSY